MNASLLHLTYSHIYKICGHIIYKSLDPCCALRSTCLLDDDDNSNDDDDDNDSLTMFIHLWLGQ